MMVKMRDGMIIRSPLEMALRDPMWKDVVGGDEVSFRLEAHVILAKLITFWVRERRIAPTPI
jgi:hypothetical protein